MRLPFEKLGYSYLPKINDSPLTMSSWYFAPKLPSAVV